MMIVIKQHHPAAADIIDKAWNDMILCVFDIWIFIYARRRASMQNGSEQKQLYYGNLFFANSELSFK